LKSARTVSAWGDDTFGQLGDSSTFYVSVPVQVVGAGGTGRLTSVAAIAGGLYHSLALKGDGTVWAWGGNLSGQLGNNSTASASVPVPVLGPDGVGFLKLRGLP
jgi:alpha-tubulin suppressor-like RCC1 family protein